MFFILFIVIVLVAWALHLMEQAMNRKEFSLMLAGFLVSVAAAGLVAVYFLMGHFVGYMDQMAARAELAEQYYESTGFYFPPELVVETRVESESAPSAFNVYESAVSVHP
ncbi:hypothetical protein ACQ4M4_06240 [Leptolyngbya sp. AN02str]|uniref:hypothetical protein n=1 Tax=Leptolyngbya sp. AN02str TaxID=3423363 RepID=UPI003D319697